jgi:hypothetical protein
MSWLKSMVLRLLIIMSKKIPYGESNFKNIILDNSLYIDKTRFIEILENNHKYTIFLRPRRFGKSIFISTLLYYYDQSYKNIWEELFGELYIGKNATALKSSYQILYLEFSGIVTDSIETTYLGFKANLKNALLNFLKKYSYQKTDIEQLSSEDAPEILMSTFFKITSEARIYLLIDEYDHFANSILGTDLDLFKDMVGKGGFVRSFYETIKSATQKGIVERFFITGVTPLTLDSMTSGFNIAKNITYNKEFNDLAGFTLDETKIFLDRLYEDCPKFKLKSKQEKLIKDITHFYNGYLFSPLAKDKIYNANLLMYFVDTFDKENCTYPMKMLDSNIASDYVKIMQIFAIGDKESNYEVLTDLIYTGEVIASLKDKFNFATHRGDGFSQDEFISLLFALGFVTIKEQRLNQIKFVIPNYVIKHLYFNYFQRELEQRNNLSFKARELEDALYELAINNNISPFTQSIQKVVNLLSNRDMQNFSEKHLHTLLLTLLNISDFYFIKSEMEINKHYPDIMLLERSPFAVNYQYLFELKFCKKKDAGTSNNWEQKKQQGIKQIQGYLQLADINPLKNLKSYVIISNGEDLEMVLV